VSHPEDFDLKHRCRESQNSRKAQENQNGLEMNGTHHLLVYAGYVNLLGECINTSATEKNVEALIPVSKEDGLEANTGKINWACIHVCHHQNAGQSHNIKTKLTHSSSEPEYKDS
jgi:hypothetical protein